MSINTFTPTDLIEIAALANQVEGFNRREIETSEHPMHAEVTFFRTGEEVAVLVEAITHYAGPTGSLVFEVRGAK